MKLMLQAEQLIKEHKVKFIDLRFSDTVGVQHHVTLSVKQLTEEVLTVGQPFDGSSIAGWKGIESSDMLLLPDLTTATIDQFYQDSTLAIVCDVIDPLTMQAYSCCPRGIAKKAEQWLQSLGFANQAYFGPEAEFFIFEAVTWENSIASSSYKIESTEGSWNSNTVLAGGNIGHRPSIKGGYLAMTPADSLHDIRSAMCLNLEKAGIQTELHHHEVATAGQCEIGTKYSSLVQRADWSQLFKHIVKNTAHLYGKTATFMPKPIAGDNGSGMHVHQSLWLNDVNLFAGNDYAQLSPLALYYIGGIIKHARAINALTNPTTNSYKRLVPGFEAPVMLTYSARNRSAAIRVPFANSSNGRRIEVRFPDALANPYLAFSAMLLAGIDGIINKIEPAAAMDMNLYELDAIHLAKVPTVCANLEEALDALSQDREFLTNNGIFSNEFINSFITLKRQEIMQYNQAIHPIEMQLYYSM